MKRGVSHLSTIVFMCKDTISSNCIGTVFSLADAYSRIRKGEYNNILNYLKTCAKTSV